MGNPLTRPNPRHLTIFCSLGMGNLICKAFPRDEEFDLSLGVVGKIEPEVSGFNFFSRRCMKSLTAINTRLDEMEYVKGRDIALVSDRLTKKEVFKSCVAFLKVCMESREGLNIDFRL